MLSGDATDQTPPDLPSFLFKERIVYLGMSLVPSVTELLLAEFMYLQYDDSRQPVYLYINSTGVQKGADKLGYEAEAFAIYDTMRFVKPDVGTVCVGSAYGEAAMLLAAGVKGKRAALPSSTIMLRQPIQQFAQMQASDIDIYRNEIRKTNANIVKVLARHTEHSPEKIANDIKRPKYFDPHAAVEYNLIDRVLESSELETRNAIREASKFR